MRCGAHLPALKQARRQLPIEFYAAEQLSRRFGKIKRRGRKITKLDPEKLHKFRIQVKKARYAAEFFSSIYGDKKSARRRKKVFSSLTQLQNSLGRINDIATHKALFTNIVDNPRRGLTAKQNHQRAFAAGLIIGDQQARIPALVDDACKAYARFDSAKPFWSRHREFFRVQSGDDKTRSIGEDERLTAQRLSLRIQSA